MRDLASTFRAVEFIEAHLQADVTVAEMAEAAGYSLYHFIRAFNEDTHYTPYDYLIRRRLSQAALDLLASYARVLDISLAYRFNNHETFSRAFKRLLGVQPVQWRERGLIPRRALMPPFTLPYLEHIHCPGFERPQVIEMPARCLVGLMTALPGDILQLWESLNAALPSAVPTDLRCYRWAITSYTEGSVAYYLAGVEVPFPPSILPPLVALTLPAGNYLRVAHSGPASSIPLTLDYLYHTWLPKTGHQSTYPFEIETHFPHQPPQVFLALRDSP